MKRIITSSDGTWNKPNEKDEGIISPTNVYQLKKLIPFRDESDIVQIPFYDEGVGTHWYDALPGGVGGAGINQNIKDAYRHIMLHYDEGDEIYLFGFSRGAYTARSVAGWIFNCGILKRENEEMIEQSFKLYRRRDDASHPNAIESINFRKQYCHEQVKIKFIGVWDTVGALGIPITVFNKFNRKILDCQFHDVKLNWQIENAYHAVAIDEHRVPFEVTLWKQTKDGIAVGQKIEQRWFPGVHCDVGGSYAQHALSDCTLRWMIEKARETGLAINDSSQLIQPNPTGKIHNSMSILYRILGVHNREITLNDDSKQVISNEAFQRWEQNTEQYKENANPNLKYHL